MSNVILCTVCGSLSLPCRCGIPVWGMPISSPYIMQNDRSHTEQLIESQRQLIIAQKYLMKIAQTTSDVQTHDMAIKAIEEMRAN